MHVFLHRPENGLKKAGLSVRGGGRGFPSATMNVVNGYFQERIEPKETPSCLISPLI